jgi:hypothetical protein
VLLIESNRENLSPPHESDVPKGSEEPNGSDVSNGSLVLPIESNRESVFSDPNWSLVLFVVSNLPKLSPNPWSVVLRNESNRPKVLFEKLSWDDPNVSKLFEKLSNELSSPASLYRGEKLELLYIGVDGTDESKNDLCGPLLPKIDMGVDGTESKKGLGASLYTAVIGVLGTESKKGLDSRPNPPVLLDPVLIGSRFAPLKNKSLLMLSLS